jgi:hypothetical protein
METPTETIWRNRYTDCDKGYAVELAKHVVAHGSLPPNPDHGFLISAADPATTAEVTLQNPRIIAVYDQYDAMELGSARAYLNWELTTLADKKILQIRGISFRGLPSVEGHFDVKAHGSMERREELVIYRKSGDLIYDLMLRTTDQYYTRDSAFFARMRAGFHLLPIPRGACINP